MLGSQVEWVGETPGHGEVEVGILNYSDEGPSPATALPPLCWTPTPGGFRTCLVHHCVLPWHSGLPSGAWRTLLNHVLCNHSMGRLNIFQVSKPKRMVAWSEGCQGRLGKISCSGGRTPRGRLKERDPFLIFQSDTLSPSSHFAPAFFLYPLQLLNYLSVLEKQIDKDTNPWET